MERIRQHQSKELKHEPEHHYDALRSGDYYMFDEDCEIESESGSDDSDTEGSAKSSKSALRKGSGGKTTAPKLADSVDNRYRESESIRFKSVANFAREEEQESSEPLKKSLRTSKSAEALSTPRQAILSTALIVDQQTSGGSSAVDKQAAVMAGAAHTAATTATTTPRPEQRESWLKIENKTTLKILALLSRAFFIAFDLVIGYLNKVSKDFRNVSFILKREKVILKRDFSGSVHVSRSASYPSNLASLAAAAAALAPGLDEVDYCRVIQQANREVDVHMNAQPRLKRLLSTIFYFMLSQSEMFCYFFMILNHLKSASLLSVALPLSVFLWAMLCIPRPTKTFWVACITYIELVVVLKYIFQFKVFAWNQGNNSADDESVKKTLSLLGLEKNDKFAIYDLFSLLAIFLHRTILKRMGLWRDYSAEDELLLTRNNEQESRRVDSDNEHDGQVRKREGGGNVSLSAYSAASRGYFEAASLAVSDKEKRDEEQEQEVNGEKLLGEDEGAVNPNEGRLERGGDEEEAVVVASSSSSSDSDNDEVFDNNEGVRERIKRKAEHVKK